MAIGSRLGLAVVLAVTPFTGTFFLWNISPASAYVACTSPQQSYFDGLYDNNPPNQPLGTGANIITQFGYVCDSNTDPTTNFETGWAMIAGAVQYSCGYANRGYAQSGFFRGYAQGAAFFTEDNLTGCNALRRTFHGTTNNGEQHNYTEQFLGDCSCIHEMIDGQTYQLSNFNPKASGAWPHPFESQWLGEVKYLQSNMPGSSSQITRFANLAEENYTTYQMFTNLNQATLTPQNDQPTAWYNSGLHLNQTLDGYFWIYTLNPVG